MLACADGYPSQDAVSVGAMTPAEHVRMLDTYLDDTGGGADVRLTLDDPCHLAIHDTTARGMKSAERFGLAGLEVQLATDAANGRYFVIAGNSQLAQRGFEVANWVHAVAFRSHLQQLERRCAEASSTVPSPTVRR